MTGTSIEERMVALGEVGVDFKTRTILLAEDIDDPAAQRVMSALHLFGENPRKPVTILMATAGGSIIAGWAIYDAIRSCPAPVDIVVHGWAASIGAIILQAARRRLVRPTACVLVHNGASVVHSSQDGFVDSDVLMRSARTIGNETRRYHMVIASRSGRPMNEVAEWCRLEKIFGASETVSLGLADAIEPYPGINGKRKDDKRKNRGGGIDRLRSTIRRGVRAGKIRSTR